MGIVGANIGSRKRMGVWKGRPAKETQTLNYLQEVFLKSGYIRRSENMEWDKELGTKKGRNPINK